MPASVNKLEDECGSGGPIKMLLIKSADPMGPHGAASVLGKSQSIGMDSIETIDIRAC